jgi:histidyl-tRNA synthetase
LLIGEDELANGTVWLKDLETKKEKNILIEKIYTNPEIELFECAPCSYSSGLCKM